MNINDCIAFATEHPLCYLATTDGTQPRVRAVLMFFADEQGFYFVFLTPKDMVKQLKKNPKVEVCFFNYAQDLPNTKTMRITGKMEQVRNEEIKKRALTERGFLQTATSKPLESILRVYRIRTGKAFFWTMADVLKEHELERIAF